MRVQQILETCLYVNDLDAAEAFYRVTLGLELESRQPGRHVFFHCGNSMLLLFEAEACRQIDSGIPPHGAHGPGHAAFAVPAKHVDQWRQHLIASNVAIEKEVSWPGGGRSIYFRDPSGNSLELATPSIWGLPDLLSS